MPKVLVTGSREWPPTAKALEALFSVLEEYDVLYESQLISGMSPLGGVDAFAYAWADGAGWSLRPVPAETLDGETRPRSWQFAARNRKMVDMAPDIVLAFFVRGAGNKGTRMTADMAEEKGILVRKFEYDPYTEEFREL